MSKEILNTKQARFCQEYVIDLNGTQAAIRAGYSKKTANEQSTALLAKLHIQHRVKELQDDIADRLNINADKVILELYRLGFSNMQDYISEGFEIDDIAKLDRKKAAAIESIQVTTTTRGRIGDQITEKSVKFKLCDKISALEKLGRHLGIFNDKLNLNVSGQDQVFVIGGQVIKFE